MSFLDTTAFRLAILLLVSHLAVLGQATTSSHQQDDSGMTRDSALPGGTHEAPARIPKQPAGYLYPVLPWGPSNQIAGLKEVLALGRLLKRTVVVHDILNHYNEQQAARSDTELPDGPVLTMPFELVFDQPHLSRHQSVVTQSELMAEEGGWDGVLQAVAHFDDEFLPQIKRALALNVSDVGATYIKFPSFNCTDGELKAMAAAFAPYKYVGVIVYEHIVPGAGHGVKLYLNGNACHDTFLHVTGHLVRSEALVMLASRFRDQHFGNRSYMAVHIRPYPDKCISAWLHPQGGRRGRNTRRIDKQLRASCKNPWLIKVFLNQTLEAMQRHNLSDLFVMSHPFLRMRVTEMYGTVGLKPLFLNDADLEAAIGYKSVSLLGMVEEEIALGAEYFIGTSYSSMTGIISQDRYSRGIRSRQTVVFSGTNR